MTTKRIKAPPAPSSLESDLRAFYHFATEMRAKGATKVVVCRGEGMDYIVEFEGKEEPQHDNSPRHSMGFVMDESCDDECEDD